jgi:hypothetical protein
MQEKNDTSISGKFTLKSKEQKLDIVTNSVKNALP